MIEGFTVRKLNEDLINDLIFLHKICFKKDVQESEIKNKHIYCDGINKYVGFIAYDNISLLPAWFGGDTIPLCSSASIILAALL